MLRYTYFHHIHIDVHTNNTNAQIMNLLSVDIIHYYIYMYMYLCRFNRSIAAYATMPRRKRRVEKRDSGFHSEVSSLHISHLEALLTCILTCNWKSTQTPINIYQGYIYMPVRTLYIYMSCTLYSFTFQRSDSTSHDKEQHSASPEGIYLYG